MREKEQETISILLKETILNKLKKFKKGKSCDTQDDIQDAFEDWKNDPCNDLYIEGYDKEHDTYFTIIPEKDCRELQDLQEALWSLPILAKEGQKWNNALELIQTFGYAFRGEL